MFLSKPDESNSCGIFTLGHFILIILTTVGIITALIKTKNKSKDDVSRIIKNMTIIIWILEILKIIFNLYIGEIHNVNSYLPLYYCSLLLYAGAMSSFGKGKIKRAGDVFLATGGIIGGIIFIIFPTTSLPSYPMIHFLSIYSFLFHGTMVYLGLLINITHYIKLEWKDIGYFASLVGILCIVALVINNICDSNLMFISKDFPGTPVTILYHLAGKWFTPIMIIIQMTLPFIIVFLTLKMIDKCKYKTVK